MPSNQEERKGLGPPSNKLKYTLYYPVGLNLMIIMSMYLEDVYETARSGSNLNTTVVACTKFS